MRLPIYQLDAFADSVFRGNPAAVCPVERWPDEETMQAIAAENNVSETVFFAAQDGALETRWFTPAREVRVGSHGTLAAGYVVAHELGHTARPLRFAAGSEEIPVEVDGERLTMTLSAEEPAPAEGLGVLEQVAHALGYTPWEVLETRYLVAVFDDPEAVRAMAPEPELVAAIGRMGVVATAPSGTDAVVCRVFAPAAGVPEDPVTTSAFRSLGPYWGERLKRGTFTARQISARGGEIECRVSDRGVALTGRVVKYLEGRIEV